MRYEKLRIKIEELRISQKTTDIQVMKNLFSKFLKNVSVHRENLTIQIEK